MLLAEALGKLQNAGGGYLSRRVFSGTGLVPYPTTVLWPRAYSGSKLQTCGHPPWPVTSLRSAPICPALQLWKQFMSVRVFMVKKPSLFLSSLSIKFYVFMKQYIAASEAYGG